MLQQVSVVLPKTAHELDHYRTDEGQPSSLGVLLRIDTTDHQAMLLQSLLEFAYDGQYISYILNFLSHLAHRNEDNKLATPCLSLLVLAST